MYALSIELTNACNRRCLHCLRNKLDAPEFLPLPLAREILSQAKALGFRRVCLTGGEAALYPHLQDILGLIVDHDFTFTVVTNGHRFRENLLPLFSAPNIREKVTEVCFSLDGSQTHTHDALRGAGSFREVLEAASLCQLSSIPLGLKTVITNHNKKELTEVALLGADFEARGHGFLHPFCTPQAIREEVFPPPNEVWEILEWIHGSLAKALRPRILTEGFGHRTTLFTCFNILEGAHVDYQGNLVLCCNLSHVTRDEGQPSVFGREWLADLKEVSLREGLIRHYDAVARLMEARLRDMEKLKNLTLLPCYWCFLHFGKLDWLKDFSESPWAAPIIEEEWRYEGAKKERILR